MSDSTPIEISPEARKKSGNRGLLLVFCLIGFSCMVPFVVLYLNKLVRPSFHTESILNCGASPQVQLTWQSVPEENLQHLFIFNEKPLLLEAYPTLHLKPFQVEGQPRKDFAGYYIIPRGGLFYDGKAVTTKIQKRLRDRSLKFWVVHQGNAFPIKPPAELAKQWKSHKELAKSELWQNFLEPELLKFRQDLAAGKIELKTFDLMPKIAQ